MSEFSNGLGYCYNYVNYYYDSTKLHPPGTDTMVPDPSCTALSATAMTFDAGTGGTQTVPDNLFWGCAPEPTMFTGGKGQRFAHAPSPFRPLLSAQQLKTAD